MATKLYFVLPTTTHVPDTDIRLGQIIKSYRQPNEGLLAASEDSDLIPGDDVTRTSVRGFASQRKLEGHNSASFVFEALNMFSAGMSNASSQGDAMTWAGPRLETQEFDAYTLEKRGKSTLTDGKTFTQRLVENPRLVKILRKANWRPGSPIYIITGLKIIRDPQKVTAASHDDGSRRGNLAANIDPPPGGAVTLRAEASQVRAASAYWEGTPENDFVYAYRLREIRANRFRKPKVSYGEHKGGILAGVAEHDSKDPDDFPLDDDEEGSDDDDDDWSEADLSLASEDFGTQFVEDRSVVEDMFVDETGDKCRLIRF